MLISAMGGGGGGVSHNFNIITQYPLGAKRIKLILVDTENEERSARGCDLN